MQSVLNSTRGRRVTAGVAASAASALAASVLVVGPEAGATAAPAPAGHSAAKKAKVSKAGINYKCKATNSVVNDAIGGPQKFRTNVKVGLKGKLKPGSTVKVTRVGVALVIPKKLVKKIRNQLGVKKVRGSAKYKLNVKGKKGGAALPVKGLKSGWKKLPKNKKVRIPTKGAAGKFKIKKGAKKLRFMAPKRFTINAHLRPAAVGVVKNTKMRCKVMGKPKKRNVGVVPL